jgi:hypothetical protein
MLSNSSLVVVSVGFEFNDVQCSREEQMGNAVLKVRGVVVYAGPKEGVRIKYESLSEQDKQVAGVVVEGESPPYNGKGIEKLWK